MGISGAAKRGRHGNLGVPWYADFDMRGFTKFVETKVIAAEKDKWLKDELKQQLKEFKKQARR